MIYQTRHPESSNLSITSYNSDTKILRVLYRSGFLYFFYGVQKYIYTEIASGSPRGGKIAWRILQTKYPYRQINRNYSIELSNMLMKEYGLTKEEIMLVHSIMRDSNNYSHNNHRR